MPRGNKGRIIGQRLLTIRTLKYGPLEADVAAML